MAVLIKMKRATDLLFTDVTQLLDNAADLALIPTIWNNPIQTSSATDTLTDVALRVTNRSYRDFGPITVGVNNFVIELTNGLETKTFRSSTRAHEWEDNKIQINPDF